MGSDRQRAFHARNPDAHTRYSKAWRARNPEHARKIGREQQRRRTLRYGMEKRREIAYRSILKRKYGLTVADYEAMLVAQNGCCAICAGNKPYGRGNRWHVDHDHTSGKVRGLLCSRCNTAIGLLQDSPVVAQAAVEYLSRGTRV